MNNNTPLFQEADLQQLAEHGISVEEATRQIELLQKGCPYLEVESPASTSYGIISFDDNREFNHYLDTWHNYTSSGARRVVKFVPASGAASRMFQQLYDIKDDQPLTHKQEFFFEHIEQFAFWGILSEACLRNEWKTVTKLQEQKLYAAIIKNLLSPTGMNYGALPKGLIKFHKYPGGEVRTPVDEHLAEGALYAKDNMGNVYIHFTVSPEHIEGFKANIKRSCPIYTDLFGAVYHVDFSVQEKTTDTLALNEEGLPFREEDGSLLFRPGGHGSLIENLNKIEAEIIFIKNIDNVQPDYRKTNTIIYKKLLGGILLEVRERVYNYIRQLNRGKSPRALLEEVKQFLDRTFCIKLPEQTTMEDKELVELLLSKLNRPIRVCGMVPNQGAPGGGPFIVREPDGSTSLQILEEVQLDPNNSDAQTLLKRGEYFNPVDICCCVLDYEGNHFDLLKYVNENTAFIARKNKNGRPLYALERPGLWNGAMHHWNSIFVEVPADTFSPVKNVTDLLNTEHQPAE